MQIIQKSFYKYQSLGNDFVLLDWYRKSDPAVQCALTDPGWKQFVVKVCDRHFGVGADTLLVLKHNRDTQHPEILVFNADGTQAENCLNGLRSIAHFLFMHYSFPPAFSIGVGQQMVECLIEGDKEREETILITTSVDAINYQGQLAIVVADETFEGHMASAGNPHFIIFQKKSRQWLEKHGQLIEQHHVFPHKTNVEFVWQSSDPSDHKKFHVLVYERACGITLACGSGAASILSVLYATGQIKKDEKVELAMLGGSIMGWAHSESSVVLQAPAIFVFSGSF